MHQEPIFAKKMYILSNMIANINEHKSRIAKHIKDNGVYYTPDNLADFVARAVWRNIGNHKVGTVFDPAVGEGSLLKALFKYAPNKTISYKGSDIDQDAIQSCITNEAFGSEFKFSVKDFVESIDQSFGLFQDINVEYFDVIIMNPPYVRTQNLSNEKIKTVAKELGLTGRVDLAHVFIAGSARFLRAGGILAVITSNKFMQTLAGEGLRIVIKNEFEICEVWDFGDTKLFGAAVLPMVMVLRKKPCENGQGEFYSCYKCNENQNRNLPVENDSLINELISAGFTINCGSLLNGASENRKVWVSSDEQTNKFLDSVKKNCWRTFGDVSKISVGIKTTADDVFIKQNWNSFIPRPELLKPLVTHEVAGNIYPSDIQSTRSVLYTHERDGAKKRPVDLSLYPISKKFLESNRARLESRDYIKKAGRLWYEIWVPQDPAVWSKQKIVFREISELPQFWLDNSGSVVNGDCYWIAFDESAHPDLIWLMLGIANSAFIVKYYDVVFNNKIYANRRRFMAQYVQTFPIPNPESKSSKAIIDLVKVIFNDRLPQESWAHKLDTLVNKSFGLDKS